MARIADAAGIDFLQLIGRLKRYGRQGRAVTPLVTLALAESSDRHGKDAGVT